MKITLNYIIPYIILLSGAGVLACTAAINKSKEIERPVLKSVSIGVIEAAYFQDIGEYEQSVENQLAQNEVRMIIFKSDLESVGKSGNSYYMNLIKDLEQQTRDLEDKLENYPANDADGWAKFKEDFDAELGELSYAYRSLGISKTN